MEVGVELKGGNGPITDLTEKLALLCTALVNADTTMGSEIRALKLLALTIAHRDGAPKEAAYRVAADMLLDAGVIASMESAVPPSEIRAYVNEALGMSEDVHTILRMAGGTVHPDGTITMPDGTVLK